MSASAIRFVAKLHPPVIQVGIIIRLNFPTFLLFPPGFGLGADGRPCSRCRHDARRLSAGQWLGGLAIQLPPPPDSRAYRRNRRAKINVCHLQTQAARRIKTVLFLRPAVIEPAPAPSPHAPFGYGQAMPRPESDQGQSAPTLLRPGRSMPIPFQNGRLPSPPRCARGSARR